MKSPPPSLGPRCITPRCSSSGSCLSRARGYCTVPWRDDLGGDGGDRDVADYACCPDAPGGRRWAAVIVMTLALLLLLVMPLVFAFVTIVDPPDEIADLVRVTRDRQGAVAARVGGTSPARWVEGLRGTGGLGRGGSRGAGGAPPLMCATTIQPGSRARQAASVGSCCIPPHARDHRDSLHDRGEGGDGRAVFRAPPCGRRGETRSSLRARRSAPSRSASSSPRSSNPRRPASALP